MKYCNRYLHCKHCSTLIRAIIINIIKFIHRNNKYRFNLSSDDSPSDRFFPQPSSSMTNAPEGFYIRLRRKMARASFVERVNIPRISFRIVSLQVIAIEARRKARCVFRSAMRVAHTPYDRVHVCAAAICMRHMCGLCVYIHMYLHICTFVDGRELESESTCVQGRSSVCREQTFTRSR